MVHKPDLMGGSAPGWRNVSSSLISPHRSLPAADTLHDSSLTVKHGRVKVIDRKGLDKADWKQVPLLRRRKGSIGESENRAAAAVADPHRLWMEKRAQ